MALQCQPPSETRWSTLRDEKSPPQSAVRLRNLQQTKATGRKQRRYFATWRRCVRGEIFRLRAPRGSRGDEQSGARYAVAIQSDDLPLSTLLVAPTSTAARVASFRPEVQIAGRATRLLAEQAAAVDPSRLGESVGYLSFDEMRRVDAALRIVMDL
jgi:mRNA interferase MazF